MDPDDYDFMDPALIQLLKAKVPAASARAECHPPASDLACHRLLHEDDGSQWRRWQAEAGIAYTGEADVYFDDFGIVLQAARDGFGVALSDEVVSARDLDEGRLFHQLADRGSGDAVTRLAGREAEAGAIVAAELGLVGKPPPVGDRGDRVAAAAQVLV